MSFGFAISDIVALGTLAWKLYKCCKGASVQSREIGKELNSLHTAVRAIRDEAQKSSSLLMTASKHSRNWTSHFSTTNSLGTKEKRTCDRIGFGSERTQALRERIVFHTSALNLSMTSLGISSLGRIEGKLDGLATQICAGQHVPSIISNLNKKDEQDNTRRRFATELPTEFPRAKIKGYIRGLVERGDLEEQPARPAVGSPEYLASELSESTSGLEILLPCFSTFPSSPVPESERDRFPSAPIDRPDDDAALSSMAHNEPFTIRLRDRRTSNKHCVQSATLGAKNPTAEAMRDTLPLLC